jgi:hypothetical protein
MAFDHRARVRGLLFVLALVSLPSAARAQVFQSAPSKIPQGAPFNNSSSEAVDFADVDLDGDFDCAVADGGDCCNDQNRLWVNLGGAQGGSIGFFQDETATRFPAVLDDSRDMDFADLDADGDQDLYTANVSDLSSQSCRFWINMGGLQAGTAGFFQDQTSSRWVALGQNNGLTTFSSIAPNLVLASGGYIDWSCDGVLGDFDDDGDLDLLQTTVGQGFIGSVPTRVFLNDGTGAFEEFNPSAFQLVSTSIDNGSPGLWCQGRHQQNTTNATGAECDIAGTPLGAELGDLDADFDLDLLNGARDGTVRLFANRREQQSGVLGFRDVTWTALTQKPSSNFSYEQEFGDLDSDGDLDLYGLSWSGFFDVVAFNDGNGVFGPLRVLAGSDSDESEGEFLDYDADGDLDLFVANFSGQDRLHRNDGPPSWSFTNVTASSLPPDNSISLQADACDVDADGDYDLLVANDAGQANVLLENLGTANDVDAPRLYVEHMPNRVPSSAPTRVKVQVLDNAPWTLTQFYEGVLEFRLDAGPLQSTPLHYAGANLFRAELPGTLTGVVRYRARSRDAQGNSSVSPWGAFSSTSILIPLQSFCTSKPSSIPGCVPQLVGTSTQVSKSAGPGIYSIVAAPVPGTPGAVGLLMYSGEVLSTPIQTNFGAFCLDTFYRAGAFPALPEGTAGACDGSYLWDFGAIAQASSPIIPGAAQFVQAWYRDPPSINGSNLTHGIGPIAVLP